MKVVVCPGLVLCAECADTVHPEINHEPGNIGMVVACLNDKCTMFNRPHFFPLAGVSLKPLPNTPTIILPGSHH